ncbi:MAG: peptidylprolyl isomerase [Prevotella sp.]|nr:FKBP-type peptidyl-prolyl cis-trans isomerase [Bacteroidales bacterium]MDD6744875.1 FKBP-type peptidyl-prolyl cis-trans isomerase [Bacteroidales bacterium]
MEQNLYKYISVAYQLYDVSEDSPELIEKTENGKPFVFLSGFGTTLKDFEAAIVDLAVGDNFDFVLTPEQAYGEFVEARVRDLDKEIFTINGKFDDKNIVVGAIIPLQNEDGNRFLGRVLNIGDTTVTVDLNHPLAGMTLNFKGSVLENRPATNAEIEQVAAMLSGECGCGGGCGDCGGNCGHHDADCGNDGHCGHHGEGKGKHHCGGGHCHH